MKCDEIVQRFFLLTRGDVESIVVLCDSSCNAAGEKNGYQDAALQS